MAVVLATALKNARMDLLTAAVDAGSGPGKLVIGTSALSGATGVLVEIELDDPSFGAAVSGVLTLAGVPLEEAASADGVAAKAELRDSDDGTVVSGLTVGVSGTNVIISSTTVVTGQPVRCTGGSIAHG